MALLEGHLAGRVPARVFNEDEEVDPVIRLAEFRKERGTLLRCIKGKPTLGQEQHLAALDAAILDVASGHEPEVYLAGLRKERVNVERQASGVWSAETAGYGGALTKQEHDQRAKEARDVLAHIDEQIRYADKAIARLSA